jgi:hypothetical protein
MKLSVVSCPRFEPALLAYPPECDAVTPRRNWCRDGPSPPRMCQPTWHSGAFWAFGFDPLKGRMCGPMPLHDSAKAAGLALHGSMRSRTIPGCSPRSARSTRISGRWATTRWSTCSAALRFRRTREILRLPLSSDSAPGPRSGSGHERRSRRPPPIPALRSGAAVPVRTASFRRPARPPLVFAMRRPAPDLGVRPPAPAPIRAALILPSASYCLANTTFADMSEIHRPLKTSP